MLILSLLLLLCKNGHGATRELYLDWLSRNNKPLERADDADRLKAFVKASEFVARHSDGSHSYSVGLNEMADRLPHELPRTDLTAMESTKGSPHSSQFVLKTSDRRQKRRITNVDRFLSWREKTISMDDEQRESLNWGSRNNPYNVSIVGEVANQGVCGACWSFVAAAATEALVYMSSGLHLRLSEQELIDCDRNFNRGCEGGNPVYAFDYIMKWGLTNQGNYPYREEQHSRCRRDQYVSKAAIRGYLRLPSDNQALIKRFLRMGPVATGICSTDPNFLYYTGGLFDPPECCVIQNHAVLIVGYGHDQAAEVDYFIIKNSWGRYWGDNGYMRLAIREPGEPRFGYGGESYGGYGANDGTGESDVYRRVERGDGDAYGRHGLCGVALGPSLPTDGYLMPGYERSAAKESNNSSIVKEDDDSYSDDAAVGRIPGWKGGRPGQDYSSLGLFLRHYTEMVALWWEVNRANRLFLFALALFICSCGLCVYSVYDDCVNPVYEEREGRMDTSSGAAGGAAESYGSLESGEDERAV